MSKALRVGAVSFLNARPLTAALEGEAERGGLELIYEVPSECANALREGRIDLGLIPSIDYARSPVPYYIVPDIAIGCRGAALTVRLFFRGDVAQIRSVAVDTSSLTSVALLRIVLRERYGLAPEFRHCAPDLDAMLHAADAALLIGDPVLPLVSPTVSPGPDDEDQAAEKTAGQRRSLDLGTEWLDLTGYPFIFAFWAGREGALSVADVDRLTRARRAGEERVPEIARTFQRERAGSAEQYEYYLRHHIVFSMGEPELVGLREFYRLAHEHGLIETVPELRFYAS